MTRRRTVRSRRAAVLIGALTAVLTLVLPACSTTIAGRGVAGADTSTGGSGPGSTPPTGPANGSSSAAVPTQPRANFADCRSAFNLGAVAFPAGRLTRLSFDCAQIRVPLDYSKPHGTSITLQLVKVHDSANTHGEGSLLVNPGGPGASGVNLAAGLSAQLSDSVLTHFDIIGFDPRGVGLSSPIRCLSDAQKDVQNAASPNVLTPAGFAAAEQSAKMVASLCERKYGASLPFYNTENTARDMDQIRQAVGDPQMNYLGFSYGTELGAAYAHLFPGKTRVAVLDGAVDPLTDPVTSFADQLEGFEQAFDQFGAYCVKAGPCKQLGDPREAVYNIAATAKRSPIPSSNAGETRRATSSLVYTGILSALYSRSQWPTLGQALIEAQNGDSAGLLALADQYNERYNGQYTNISDANTAISCNDSKPGPSLATIRATARSWTKRFPIFGNWSAPSLFTCAEWQNQRTPVPLPTAPTARKVLVIGNIHDPATPYQGAKDLTRTLGNAELLTWNGEGHTSYLQGSTCINNYVNTYLVSGRLPPVDTTCPA